MQMIYNIFMTVIEVQEISKNYSMETVVLKALDQVSFKVEAGEFAAISGPSGSGKSTLLNIIGLIDIPDSGKLFLNGQEVYKDTNLEKKGKISRKLDSRLTDFRRNNIGYIFQTFNLLPVLNVYENIEFPLHLGNSKGAQMTAAQKKEWIDFLLEKVGLYEWKNHRPSELSGGQRQRVAIARALVTKAPLILADEPTANLDSKNGEQILELMSSLNQELKTTFLFSTHDKKIVDMANHVIRLSDGKIHQ